MRGRSIEARNRDLDEWLRFFDPDVQTVDLLTAPGMPTEDRGIAELRRAVERWQESFDNWRVEVLELVDLDEEMIFAEVRFHSLGPSERGEGLGPSSRPLSPARRADHRAARRLRLARCGPRSRRAVGVGQ